MLETHVIDPYWRDTTWLSLVWKRLLKIRGAVWKNCPLSVEGADTVLRGSVRAPEGFSEGKPIPKNVGNYYVMKYMDIYYLHLIMDCQWRCARSEANINSLWHYFVCLFIFLNTSYCFQSCMCRLSRHMKEGKKVREGREGGSKWEGWFNVSDP